MLLYTQSNCLEDVTPFLHEVLISCKTKFAACITSASNETVLLAVCLPAIGSSQSVLTCCYTLQAGFTSTSHGSKRTRQSPLTTFQLYYDLIKHSFIHFNLKGTEWSISSSTCCQGKAFYFLLVSLHSCAAQKRGKFTSEMCYSVTRSCYVNIHAKGKS